MQAHTRLSPCRVSYHEDAVAEPTQGYTPAGYPLCQPSRGLCRWEPRSGQERQHRAAVIQPSAGEFTVPTLCLFLLCSETRLCQAGA